MKKSILSLAIVLALFSTAFAKNPDVLKNRVVSAFMKEFHQAKDVKWSSTENFIVASFEMNKETQFAYYDFQGNLVGVVHHILTSSLPETLRNDIKKDYCNYWVSELFQVTTDQGIQYYVQLKNGDNTIVLTAESNGNWRAY